MTSLAYIFTMEKAQSRNVFAVNFYLSTDFQKFCGTFYDFLDEKE